MFFNIIHFERSRNAVKVAKIVYLYTNYESSEARIYHVLVINMFIFHLNRAAGSESESESESAGVGRFDRSRSRSRSRSR